MCSAENESTTKHGLSGLHVPIPPGGSHAHIVTPSQPSQHYFPQTKKVIQLSHEIEADLKRSNDEARDSSKILNDIGENVSVLLTRDKSAVEVNSGNVYAFATAIPPSDSKNNGKYVNPFKEANLPTEKAKQKSESQLDSY